MMTLFVMRPFDSDKEMTVLECVTCPWFTTYVDRADDLRTDRAGQTTAEYEARLHARTAHRGMARCVLGWRP